MNESKQTIHDIYIFSLLCPDYIADLIKKLELCLTVVSILLKIRFGYAQISVENSLYQTLTQNLVQRLHTQKLWHNQNPGILRTLP